MMISIEKHKKHYETRLYIVYYVITQTNIIIEILPFKIPTKYDVMMMMQWLFFPSHIINILSYETYQFISLILCFHQNYFVNSAFSLNKSNGN
jgi:hypothetical protein